MTKNATTARSSHEPRPLAHLRLDTVAARIAAHDPVAVSAEDAPRRAAVAIVLRETDAAPERGTLDVLFIRRVEHPDDPWSGHIAFPGGHVDDSDRNAVAAAIRETGEEVGVDLDRDARLLGRLDDVRARAGGRILPMAITPVVFALERPVDLRPEPAEVDDAFWLPLEPLAAGAHASTLRYRRPELGEVDLPCWRVNGHVIWGLTYLMTWELFSVVGHGNVPPDPRFVRDPSAP